MRVSARVVPLLLLLIGGCSGEALLHGLEERQANEVLVALDEGGLAATKRREEGPEGGWLVVVASADAGRARRVLSERELPRYLHALSGELSRSIESLDGVVEARVHLGLPQDDPLRPGQPRMPRAAVLVRCRPTACAGVRTLEPGIRALVAGGADGLSSETVSVLIAEAAAVPGREPSKRPGPGWRTAASAVLAIAAVLLAGAALRRPLSGLLRRSAA
jgi:type III secretion protein J